MELARNQYMEVTCGSQVAFITRGNCPEKMVSFLGLWPATMAVIVLENWQFWM